MKIKRNIHFLLALTLLISCTDSPTGPESVGERGDFKRVELIEQYAAETIRQAVQQNNYQSPLEFTSDVEVYRVVYYTIDPSGNKVEASGALMVPVNATDAAPLLSLQHGTVLRRTNVASEGAFMASEGLVGVVFTAAEYVTVLPDYLGYGVSKVMHPYVHSAGNANVVIDMIRAVKSWCAKKDVDLNDQLFLGGYSEGGYVTMATQKMIEENFASELSLTAVAPAAGPFDLTGFVDRIMEDLHYPVPANPSFLLTAYDDIYGWNMLDDIFQEPYVSQMSELFDGSKTGEEVGEILPDSLQNLIRTQFVQDYRAGNLPGIESAFEDNTLLDWAPQTPIHLYHGTADQLVDVQNSLIANDRLSANGTATVEITTYQGLNHYDAAERAYNDMAGWFETFRQ